MPAINPNPLLVANLFGIHGRVAVITGGGTGLGEMMAEAWVVNGGHVVIAARKEEVLSKTCERLNQLGTGKAEYICGDVSSKAGCTELCDKLKKKFEKIHVLVNNSGTYVTGDFHQLPEKDWDDVFNLNVKSIFYMTSELTPLLAKDATNLNPGRVIVISSVQAFNNHSVFGEQGIWSYSSSKAAAVSLATNLAVTLGPKLITVNAICPGIFPSNLTADVLEQAKDSANSKHPMGRMGGVEDMAGIFLFLASRAGAHLSGDAILVDGGATVAGKCPHDPFEP
ncbi:hypothetical protein PCANC_04506 [Puccinia coronata f. sp. avenae]|uniref:Uncharacterized protein n=1 Tax=Puccinia coronata f. sp. avenae TaxID=200324 RepID=A0A2N5TAP5_9BASI|nr:hypothetical protein PCASD_14014 [Puccinia coronata f. sp. avenae]PLW41759.1 hypothetical protein PCASD_05678 [Puccinia coronata f. sp. avenae]PLW54180.1 hypothetical protein PCANC_04506 [Puccinia coronata f. sp. avenae]